MQARYVPSICLQLVEFLCTRVSRKIRNSITRENYHGMHHVYMDYITNYDRINLKEGEGGDNLPVTNLTQVALLPKPLIY